jgi:DNA-dependent RNA polymerase auxiliary subunit epsilon
MKHTPLTDRNIYDINTIIEFLNTLKDENVLYEKGTTRILELFDVYLNLTKKIGQDEIKSEFWDLANDFKYPVRLKSIYKIKFKQLLNWTKAEKFDLIFITDLSNELLYPFLRRHVDNGLYVDMEDAMKISTSFQLIITSLFTFKEDIESLLVQCDAYAGVYDNNTRKQDLKDSNYRIASKRKTDVVKILSAMYDCRMFVDKQGKPITNKQELMEAFGEFFNDDLSTYSTLLTQAKNKDHDTFFKPFDQINRAITKYYEGE